MEIENKTQWHPAFCSAIELELRENKSCLEYDREHNLSSEPLRIDLLVIKKKPDETIKNEIGAFFLGNNIMEYKSPDDGLNIDTFYKVLSYACLYKSDTGGIDEILDNDITISLIREGKPAKLLRQLSQRYEVVKKGNGIYYIDKMLFPMQIIVTKELNWENHVWLKSLTRSLERKQAEELLDSYEKLEDEKDCANAGAIVKLVSDLNDEVFMQIISGGERMTKEMKLMLIPEFGELWKRLEDSEARLADSETRLADKDAELADKDAQLADKDAEIAILKRMVAEFRKTE